MKLVSFLFNLKLVVHSTLNYDMNSSTDKVLAINYNCLCLRLCTIFLLSHFL